MLARAYIFFFSQISQPTNMIHIPKFRLKRKKKQAVPPAPPPEDMVAKIFDNTCIFNCTMMHSFAQKLTAPLYGHTFLEQDHPSVINGFNSKMLTSLFGGGPEFLWHDIWTQYEEGVRKLLKTYKGKHWEPVFASNFIQQLYHPGLHDSLKRHGPKAQMFFYEETKRIFVECLMESENENKFEVMFREPSGQESHEQFLHGNIAGCIRIKSKQ